MYIHIYNIYIYIYDCIYIYRERERKRERERNDHQNKIKNKIVTNDIKMKIQHKPLKVLKADITPLLNHFLFT